MLGGDPCYPYPAHGNWAQLNYVVRIVAVAPKLLCMDYPGPRQHWKLLSLQTLGTKRWIKENLSTTVEKFKHCFMVFLVSFFLLVSFWGLTAPWGKSRSLCLWKEDLERWEGSREAAQCRPVSHRLRMMTAEGGRSVTDTATSSAQSCCF